MSTEELELLTNTELPHREIFGGIDNPSFRKHKNLGNLISGCVV